MEKSVLEQANSKYELQGEYVFPGTRDRFPMESQSNGFIEKAMGGHLGSMMSSMGRWRMRLEVPGAEVAEMLPLARLLSRSTDPAIRSRSKVHAIPFGGTKYSVYLWSVGDLDDRAIFILLFFSGTFYANFAFCWIQC